MRGGGTALGAWLSVPGPITAEAAARTGFEYVCVDTQHGMSDENDAVAMIPAILLGGSSPVVRVRTNDASAITKMLDAGAHGVIVPLVDSAEQARAAVAAGRYAPDGTRSYGPSVAAMRVDGDFRSWTPQNAIVIPMIETATALANLDEILAVDGVDAVYVGPADLSLTLGLAPGNNDDVARFVEALDTIVESCRRHGVVAGIHASASLAARRLAQGFAMVTVSTDLVAMRETLAADLAAARGT